MASAQEYFFSFKFDDALASCIKLMLGLHRIVTNLGPIHELKNSGFLGLVSSRQTFIVRSQANVYIDVEEWLTYK